MKWNPLPTQWKNLRAVYLITMMNHNWFLNIKNHFVVSRLIKNKLCLSLILPVTYIWERRKTSRNPNLIRSNSSTQTISVWCMSDLNRYYARECENKYDLKSNAINTLFYFDDNELIHCLSFSRKKNKRKERKECKQVSLFSFR
jgi:hypothetical protein